MKTLLSILGSGFLLSTLSPSPVQVREQESSLIPITVSLLFPSDVTEVEEFLKSAADARMVNIEEAKLAQERGTTKEIRAYAAQMLNDQTTLLIHIEEIATDKAVNLPSGISEKKRSALDELDKASGKEFDELFIQLMSDEHERDIKRFKKATHLSDEETKKFASHYLPMIEWHLEKIKSIKKQE